MKFIKSKFILVQLAVFFGLIVLDQLSKYFAFWNSSQTGFLGFSLSAPVKNHYLIFGWSFGLNDLLITTMILALLSLCIFYYILSLIFVDNKLLFLKTGITCLIAGLISNLTNKIFNGYVIDFIKWSPSANVSLYFNLADIFQTIGWFLIVSQLIFFKKYAWKGKERRSRLLVLKKYQIQFITYTAIAFLCLSSFFILANYQWFELIVAGNTYNLRQLSFSFIKYSYSILFFLCLFITSFFFYLSNKIYGPIYAFEKYINSLIKGENPRNLKLRKGDQLKNLEALAKDIKEAFDKSK